MGSRCVMEAYIDLRWLLIDGSQGADVSDKFEEEKPRGLGGSLVAGIG